MNRLSYVNGQQEAYHPSNKWQLSLDTGPGDALGDKTTGPDFVTLGEDQLVRRKISSSTAEEIWLVCSSTCQSFSFFLKKEDKNLSSETLNS